MSGENKEAFVEKEKVDSKVVSNKADGSHKPRKKPEKKVTSSPKNEASSSTHFSSHRSHRNFQNKNIAENRLKKLRVKLDAEIKLKERIDTVGVSRLLDESVVKIEKSKVIPSKLKSPRPAATGHRVYPSPPLRRNIAAERLKKIKKEVQAVIENAQNSAPEPVLDKYSLMEIDECMSQADEPSSAVLHQNSKKTSLGHNVESANRNDPNFDAVPFKINVPRNTDDDFFKQSSNTPNNNDSHPDVVPFVNDEIYKIRQEPCYMALHTNFMSDFKMDLDMPDGDLLIVTDTNVFLSHLKIVDYLLKNSSFPCTTLNSCVLVAPWLVIQEIDYAMKKNNERLNNQARSANNFINECLKKKHPRFFGQSLIDFKENFKNAVSIDDFILQYCMKFVSCGKKVILLTNDKNLCTKGIVNSVSVLSTKEFVDTFNLSELF
ncbi:transcriptional protein SWT1-like [Planococcus citri]|uniref:transcriptional protein SWT1-like n=1 Tax=Planococcus citri TaxID=170843 RepID=UPI0031F7EC25